MEDNDQAIVTAAQPAIEASEGRRLHVYRDTLGIPTVGIGCNLEAPGVREMFEACGANYDEVLAGTADLGDAQCDYIYRCQATAVLRWLVGLFPAFFTYTQNRQVALLDQGFNLGETRFREFRGEISAILSGEWEKAAQEALDSVWAKQVGERATRDAAWLAQG